MPQYSPMNWLSLAVMMNVYLISMMMSIYNSASEVLEPKLVLMSKKSWKW